MRQCNWALITVLGIGAMKDKLKKNRKWSAQLLTWVAGYVDLVGWVVLYHIYTANMSGNTIASGLRFGNGDWAGAFARLYPVAAFAAGVLVNGIVYQWAKRQEPSRYVFPIIMAAEAVLLVVFLALGLTMLPAKQLTAPSAGAWVALATVAGLSMGVQNGALAASGQLSVYTTHVTGTLTRMVEHVAEYLYWLRDRTRGRLRQRLWPALRVSPRQKCVHEAVLHFGLWFFYLLGATLGDAALGRFGIPCLVAPIGVVLAAGMAALRWRVGE